MLDETLTLLETRRSAATLALKEPGPDAAQMARILQIAARVPDHGALTPWRFIVIAGEARAKLAQSLMQALMAAGISAEATALARTKITKVFTLAPSVVIVVSCPKRDHPIPEIEQVLSAGAACMNLILAARALGFGANWVTGWAAADPIARSVLGVQPGEAIAGIIMLGTDTAPQPDRPRPELATLVSYWDI